MMVDVLGTVYSIAFVSLGASELEGGGAIINTAAKAVFVARDHEDWKRLLRHELIHAFLYESGLDCNSLMTSEPWAINEEMVDWFAIMTPKIFRVFAELDLM